MFCSLLFRGFEDLPLLVMQLLHACLFHILDRQSVKWTQWISISMTRFSIILGEETSSFTIKIRLKTLLNTLILMDTNIVIVGNDDVEFVTMIQE